MWKLVVAVAQHFAGKARDRRRWPRAALIYRCVLAIDARNALIWVQLGHTLKESGNLQEAEIAYRNATQVDATSPDAFLHVGHLLSEKREPVLARDAYREALSLCGIQSCEEQLWLRAEIESALGNVARDVGEWRIAIHHYRNSLQNRADNVPIWIQLGHSLMEEREVKEAESTYRVAIGLAPLSADAHLHLGHALSVQSRRGEAIAAYVTANHLNDDSEDARQALLSAVGYSPAEFERHLLGNKALLVVADAATGGALEQPSSLMASDIMDGAGPDVVWLSNIEWHFRLQRPQHLASALADAGARILYVSMLCDEAIHEISFRVIGSPHRRIREIRTGFVGGQYAWVAQGLTKPQSEGVSSAIRLAMQDYGFSQPVIIVEDPSWLDVSRALSRRLLVYDCVDKIAGFEGALPSRLEAEESLLRESDIVVVTSAALAEEFAACNPTIIRNGVDFDEFSRASVFPNSHLQPLLGYYGALREWFAMDWIVFCARRHPEWTFWLVGRKERRFLNVEGLSNVKFLGEQPYEKLPGYLEQFDVALIPFLRNDLTIATNPVKLYEYLAAGKPVVATDLPEMMEAGDLVYLARDEESFERSILAALEKNSSELITKRVNWAAENSWAARARQLLSLVGE